MKIYSVEFVENGFLVSETYIAGQLDKPTPLRKWVFTDEYRLGQHFADIARDMRIDSIPKFDREDV